MPLEQLIWDGQSATRNDPHTYAAPDGADWQKITSQVQATQRAVAESAGAFTLMTGQNMLAGQPFYVFNNRIWPAQANDETHADACGFVFVDAPTGSEAVCGSSGQVTREDWSAVALTEKLSLGATYFLHPTIAGLITTEPPSLPGEFVVQLGKALTPETLDIRIESPIGL